ncbi:TPA: hydroxymethylglutaryl-CoA reductase, degradative [Candidatus Dependentiae bacterium]|nr:MAG: Hydroxymethylglutaryl-CoA reductase, degradative [candidate division TM6 bacterium GW2011_GWE2_31_21]KKP53753.1 MAG: Hydroxymethylglutaryl-CoA reductase, degradative [candidate division TM6 bacterium GW2011_GWF2_33_332]HBS48493.1 hydroxymethylglutaryl-CoA reductase, degradative [Candidatus Dependentiae bacterium]HBZ73108.1 hydroxymethylglutaryl-CoA reductase, degradative [Candidatus Dependentiae bacterium]
MRKSSRIGEFYKKNQQERLDLIRDFANLTNDELLLLRNLSLDFSVVSRLAENVISVFPMPLGIATNFLINQKDYLIPMVTEESSVIAAASNAAKLARFLGGFISSASEPIMIGQIQLTKIPDFQKAKNVIDKNKQYLIDLANLQDPILVEVGGGVVDLQIRELDTERGKMMIVHLLINVKDAMGANIVDTMLEAVAEKLESLSGGTKLLRIVSNLATYRIAEAKATWSKEDLGEEVIENILDAYAFAKADFYRCATHNKGIMNGVDAVAIATGNDFRAIEAGAHSFAALENNYQPLTKYYKNENGDLVGEIKLPLPVGIIGGSTQANKISKICLKILDVRSAQELSGVIASVGLAQNFAALRALVCEGIQAGHMKLHAKKVAINAGASNGHVDLIASRMVEEKNISIVRAKEILAILKEGK